MIIFLLLLPNAGVFTDTPIRRPSGLCLGPQPANDLFVTSMDGCIHVFAGWLCVFLITRVRQGCCCAQLQAAVATIQLLRTCSLHVSCTQVRWLRPPGPLDSRRPSFQCNPLPWISSCILRFCRGMWLPSLLQTAPLQLRSPCTVTSECLIASHSV